MKGFPVNKLNVLYYELMAVLLFALPLSKQLVPTIIILIAITSFTNGVFINELKTLFGNKLKLLLLIYFILTLAGSFFAENMATGLFELEIKLSFLILPFIISSSFFTIENFKKLKLSFVYGNVSAVLLCMANSLYHYTLNANSEDFFYVKFSVLIHSSYFALYLIISIGFMLFSKVHKSRVLSAIILLILSTGVLLSASRSGYVCLFLLFSIFFYQQVFSNKNMKIGALALLLLCSAIGVIMSFPVLQNRVLDAYQSAVSSNTKPENRSSRIVLWENAFHAMKNNLILGVGSTNVREELSQEYEKSNLTYAKKYKLNAHNQFLQTQLSFGIAGTVVLCVIFYFLFKQSLFPPDFSKFNFSLMVFTSFLFESMLETQAGIIFFVLFVILFFNEKRMV